MSLEQVDNPATGDPCKVQTKRTSCDPADMAGDQKKLRLDTAQEYSHDAVKKYLTDLKMKQLELLLDLNMENFFLENQGNIMDLPYWKKKPVTDMLRQYIIRSGGEELETLLSSKLPPEIIPATKATVHIPSEPLSAPSISLPPSSRQSQNHVPEHPETVKGTPSAPRSRSTSNSLSKVTSVVNSAASAYASRPHGTRQKSISVVYENTIGSQEQIVERAKQEAHVMQRIAELRKEGLWSAKKLPKVQEAPRVKAHWDYLLEEMQWLASDFGFERKWKKAAAKKCARMVTKYWMDKEQKKEKEKRDEIARSRKIASTIAKEVRTFWESAEKLVSFKQQTRLEKKRKQALDMHLNFIVGQTEQYTQLITEGLKSNTNSEVASHVDSEFLPNSEDVLTDDEETIAKEEKENDPIGDKSELELLQQDMELPFDELLQSLPPEVLEKPASINGSDGGESDGSVGSDGDYKGEDSEPDQEDTIAEQEAAEGKADYDAEIRELEDDANLTREELLKKYSIPPPDESMDSTICDDQTESEERTEEELTEEDLSDKEEEEVGLEFLAEIGSHKQERSSDEKTKPSREISDIAAGAEEIQPKGYTIASCAKPVTEAPSLLRGELREYQRIGLDWLVAMYDKKLNGILADEMGLGKTIQTIALLAHLACVKGIWGPHLIVVPTSVMLNWEMEFKKWCPAFKTLTYYGSPKERKAKRQGWTKPNQFHVCITSYKLVVQDHQSFRRKKWRYLILDEAQHIKNFKSQRWQMLLNFNTSRRLLLTGTPLQNNLMELWSLMHFLMPNVFASHRDFKDWFVNPVTGMIEGNQEYNEELVRRLHKILRPFLLRRLKKDVEKQLPQKHEHIIMCRLSKRQRFLYEEYMSLSKTKETLATGNFLSVINVLMQLRKVCNHPDLFETRPIISPFAIEGLLYETSSLVTKPLLYDPLHDINLSSSKFDLIDNSIQLSAFMHHRINCFKVPASMIEQIDSRPDSPPRIPRGKIRLQITTKSTGLKEAPPIPHAPSGPTIVVPDSQASSVKMTNSVALPSGNESNVLKKLTLTKTEQDPSGSQRVKIPMGNLHVSPTGQHLELSSVSHQGGVSSTAAKPLKRKCSSPYDDQDVSVRKEEERRENLQFLGKLNEERCCSVPIYPKDLVEAVTLKSTTSSPCFSGQGLYYCQTCLEKVDHLNQTDGLRSMLRNPEKMVEELDEDLDRFVIRVPPVSGPGIKMHVSHPDPSLKRKHDLLESELHNQLTIPSRILHKTTSHMMTQFPELRLIQYDCGKLQTLDALLWQLKSGGHRALIFTQMSRMLDIFEQFLNYHGHTYLRLDGATKIEARQSLMERFNADPKIFCFILSTRSGGVGVNLTGADTVIFYDSDWNPTMDAQAQDRCHRIGQTKDVHIYRLISERTIEENILRKAQQKKLLGDLAIEEGNFTTAFFKENAIRELFGEGMRGQGNDIRDMVTQEPTGLEDVAASAKVWEAGIEAVEEQMDVVAAKTSKAEANAELAEFDENVPLDTEMLDGDDKSPAEDELEQLVAGLTPIEKFALKYLESNQDEATTEYLKAAEEEIEQSKKDWEMEHMKNLKEAERVAAEEENSDVEAHLTISRQDVYDQVYFDGDEVMPLWTPPTPPQDDSDVYVDHCMAFMYEQSLMAESELPPVYIPKNAKRLKLDTISTVRSKQRVKRDEVTIPRSLFDRPPMAILKLRRELKSLKMKGHLVGGPDVLQLHKILAQLGPNLSIVPPMTLLAQAQNSKSPQLLLAGLQQENQPEWTIAEEYATLQAIQQIQELPTNLVVVSPAHTPNWDLVSDFVSSNSLSFRSPRICRHHYESVVVPREEGKGLAAQEGVTKKNKKQKISGQPGEAVPIVPSPPKARPIRTTVLFRQDDNTSSSKNCDFRFETIHAIAGKRTGAARPVFAPAIGKSNPKHIALLLDSHIDYDQPLTPMDIATKRQERLASEKAKSQQLQAETIARQKQQLQAQKLAQQQQLKAQQMVIQQQQQSPIRPQVYGSVPAPVLAPRAVPSPMPPMTPPTRNQEVEQLAQQLSQAAANFTAATQAQQAQMASNISRPSINPDQNIVGGMVSYQPQVQVGQLGMTGRPMAPQQMQALTRAQAVVRTRQIAHPNQGHTIQLHQLPTPTRFQIATTGQQINLPTSLPLSSSQPSGVASSTLQVTAGQRIITTKTGQQLIRQATEADLQQLLRPRAQVQGQQARLSNLAGQILQIQPVQTSSSPSLTPSSMTTAPLMRSVTPQSTLSSTSQTVTIPISVAGMNIISSQQQKQLPQVPGYQVKQIPLSMIPTTTRRIPNTTQVSFSGQQLNQSVSVSTSQVTMQPQQQQPMTSQHVVGTMASTSQAKPIQQQQKNAPYGTIQILQSSAGGGQKLQIQQLQQIIKSGGLVLGSPNILQTPGQSNLVIRPTTSGEGGLPQTSISLTHQQLQQLNKMTQAPNIGKNIVVSGQQISGAQLQNPQGPFTLAIRTNPPTSQAVTNQPSQESIESTSSDTSQPRSQEHPPPPPPDSSN